MNEYRRHKRLRFHLREHLAARHWTIGKLSEVSGISTGTIGDLLTGRSAMPSDENLVRLCDALHVETLITVVPANA